RQEFAAAVDAGDMETVGSLLDEIEGMKDQAGP
ncbi:unnamed protein product, partial [marine sediment metagenome]